MINKLLCHENNDLHEVFDKYYSLMFGFYNLDEVKEPETLALSKQIKNEVFDKNGKFFSLFEKIGNVERKLADLEYNFRKNEKNFNVDNGLVNDIKDLYDDAIRNISEQMFMYGVEYGNSLKD